MELDVVTSLTQELEKESKKFQGDATLVAFEQASIEFEELVKKGIAKRRGYNLMTIEGKHLQRYCVNSNEVLH
jgi:hypothetical protein